MTNEEKYKTMEERAKAFSMFCENQDRCTSYPAHNTIGCCYFRWLAFEAEEEQPEPCPFCGAKCEVTGAINHWVKCIECNYESTLDSDKGKAIAAHNRVCRAVRAYKEREVAK